MPKKIIDPKTQKKVDDHLRDKNDKISDDDIRDAKTTLEDTGENINKNDNGNDDRVKDNADPGIRTPWNILGE